MAERLCSCGGEEEHDANIDLWIDNLRDILKLKFPFVESGTVTPPFTPRQMITMAILSHPEKKAPSCLIPFCIGEGFSTIFVVFEDYMRALLIDELNAYDCPFHIDKDGQMTVRSGCEDEGLYQEPDNRKIPFLDFPPELRLEIYRLALVFTTDKDGVRICQGFPTWRGIECVPSFGVTINGVENCRIPAGQVLALLSANRQLNTEAKPVFYGQNRFEFYSVMPHLAEFLSGIGRDRRQHLRSVSFSYPLPSELAQEPEKSLIDSAFFLLCEANLQYLHLDMDEESHFRKNRRRSHSVQQIPGLWILRKFRGIKEVTFGGESYERTEKFLKDEMLKPKGDRGERALLKRKR